MQNKEHNCKNGDFEKQTCAAKSNISRRASEMKLGTLIVSAGHQPCAELCASCLYASVCTGANISNMSGVGVAFSRNLGNYTYHRPYQSDQNMLKLVSRQPYWIDLSTDTNNLANGRLIGERHSKNLNKLPWKNPKLWVRECENFNFWQQCTPDTTFKHISK